MTGNFFYSIHTLCGEFTCQSNYIQIALLIIPYKTVTTRAHNVCNIWIDISSTNVLYILHFFTESCINVTSTVSSREQPRSWCRLTCLQIRECLCFSPPFYSCSDSTWIWIYKQIKFFNKCRYIAIQELCIFYSIIWYVWTDMFTHETITAKKMIYPSAQKIPSAPL